MTERLCYPTIVLF